MASTIRDVAARAELSDMLPALFCIEALCSFSGPFGGPFFYKLCKFIKSYILSKSPLNALVISI